LRTTIPTRRKSPSATPIKERPCIYLICACNAYHARNNPRLKNVWLHIQYLWQNYVIPDRIAFALIELQGRLPPEIKAMQSPYSHLL